MPKRVPCSSVGLLICVASCEASFATECTAPSQGRQLIQLNFEAQVPFFQKLRDPGQSLDWQPLRRFSPLPVTKGEECSNVGWHYPRLVTSDEAVMKDFNKFACETAPHFFMVDPTVSLTAETAELDGGCINMPPWPEVTMAANFTHGEFLYRSCPENCLGSNVWENYTQKLVDADLLVIPSIRALPGMVYQHALLDFLGPAYTALSLLKNSSLKLVVTHSLHTQLLKLLGVPEEQIFEIDLGNFTRDDPRTLLCTRPGRKMHLFRVAGTDGKLPTMPFGDRRVYSDFWHRLTIWQVGPEISDKIAQRHQLPDAGLRTVLFLQRCSSSRSIANEQAALALSSKVLLSANRPHELISICAGWEDVLEQVKQVRAAGLVVGEHGGALANVLFALPGTGIIEFVGNAAAHVGLEGVWPPYKSYWYGGAGAAFSFFRVVLYEPDFAGTWQLRLGDLEIAVQQWLEESKPA